MIVVHFVTASDEATQKLVVCKTLETTEPIPPGTIWIDMIEATIEEDQKVQKYVGAPVPTKSDPDYTEPPEAHYAENGVRYLHASVISEPEDTPDITGVTFVIAPTTLVTVRYHPVEFFDLFSQKICKSSGQALFPDAVAIGPLGRGNQRNYAITEKQDFSAAVLDCDLGNAEFRQSPHCFLGTDVSPQPRLVVEAGQRDVGDIENLAESRSHLRRVPPEAWAYVRIIGDDGSFRSRIVEGILEIATPGLSDDRERYPRNVDQAGARIFPPPAHLDRLQGDAPPTSSRQ